MSVCVCVCVVFPSQQTIKSLLAYIVDNFMSTLSEIEYVDTFQNIKLKHEQAMEHEENPPDASTAW